MRPTCPELIHYGDEHPQHRGPAVDGLCGFENGNVRVWLLTRDMALMIMATDEGHRSHDYGY